MRNLKGESGSERLISMCKSTGRERKKEPKLVAEVEEDLNTIR